LVEVFGICIAPQRVAEELLRREGFNDVQYAEKEGISGIRTALASGEADISMQFAAPLIMALDAGDPILLLAGGHAGCFELFGSDRVRTIRDLKGKTVAVPELGIGEHIFIASMVAYVGLDPHKDITIVAHSPADSMRLLSEGKIDAYMAFPPDSQELRAKRIGHVLINSMIDRPWSQYFCCLVAANREFVRKRPVAVNRALRAILRAADICAREPERAARFLVDKGVAANYDFAVQLMKDIPYDKWREYDPEDTVRFYALRLQEAGMIKAIPQKIISQGTDWRFLNALKKELKE
jgi:NitT/TauT family transport system substrate-binding protein